jgi:hypothetical protein
MERIFETHKLTIGPKESRTANRRLAKKQVRCLNEVLCLVSSSLLVDSSVLRNPLLRQAPKRYVGLPIPEKYPKFNLK